MREQGVQNVDWRIKESILNIVGNLAEAIYSQIELRVMMEEIMMHHVMDELNSAVPYLKWRAIWFYSQFEKFYPL